jgi:TM2 domain-containing membrane protein YozV
MTQSARDFENTFVHAWALLVRNPVIIVPGIVIGVLAAAAEEAVEFFTADAFSYFGDIAIFAIALALTLVQMAYVTGMSGGAWRHERTSLRDGWEALAHRALPAAGAGALLLLIGFCAAALAPATLYVTLIGYAIFFVYTMAAVVIGDRAPIAGIVESANTALKNVLPTIGVIALIAVIAAIGGWLGSLAGHVADVAGWLLSGLIQQVVVAYASLVVAGEYLKLTHGPTQS